MARFASSSVIPASLDDLRAPREDPPLRPWEDASYALPIIDLLVALEVPARGGGAGVARPSASAASPSCSSVRFVGLVLVHTSPGGGVGCRRHSPAPCRGSARWRWPHVGAEGALRGSMWHGLPGRRRSG
jgi:hypothetical protein